MQNTVSPSAINRSKFVPGLVPHSGGENADIYTRFDIVSLKGNPQNKHIHPNAENAQKNLFMNNSSFSQGTGGD